MPSSGNSSRKTAFVFAGGGSFGAIQVGMMQALAAHGVVADMVVGSSVGALNGAYYAGAPTLDGVKHLAKIWRGLRRQDVFPVSTRTLLGFLWRRDFLITHDGVRKLIDDHLPYKNLQDAKLPVHIVTTNIVTGGTVVLSEGPAAEAIVASTSIPGIRSRSITGTCFSPTARSRATRRSRGDRKGRTAANHSADRICLCRCRRRRGSANVLHAVTLLISRQMIDDLDYIDPSIEYHVVPPLCPLVGSPYDFSRTTRHVERRSGRPAKWSPAEG